MSEELRPFFYGFKPQATFIKAGVHWCALAAFINQTAPYDTWIGSLNSWLLTVPHVIPKSFGLYLAGLYAIEMLKLRFNRDLQLVKIDNQKQRSKRRK